MVPFILLFLPEVLTVWIYEALAKKALTRKSWAMFYATCVLLVNTACFFIFYKILNWGGIAIENPQEGVTFYIAASYLMIALPIAVVLGVVAAFLKKYIRVEIEEKTDAA